MSNTKKTINEMNKMKVALATALKFPNWQLCRLCLLLLLFAGTWQGSHAAYMYVKGTASPYYKIGDGSFNQMTNHFNTSDGTIWYYANVDNGSTVTFASSSDGANASPAIPFDSSNDSYFYFGEGIGINLTSQKTSTSCFYFSAGSWWTNDNAVFRCHMWNSNTSTTWPGVEGTVVGGYSNTTIYAFEQSFTPTGIKFTRLTLDNDQLVVQNETSNIENTDLSNGEYYIVNAANNYPYDSKIDTYIVTAWPNRDIFTGELYLIGQANENSWQPNVGIKMTAMNSAKTHFKANNVHFKPSNDGFAFATQLSNDWTTLNAHRLGSNGDGNRWTITENLLNQWNNNLQVDYNYEKNFVVDVEGDYDVEVNLETMQVKVTQAVEETPFTGNFYGPGYYRIVNHGTDRTLTVIGDKISDQVLSAVQMETIDMVSAQSDEEKHNLHANAGSILSAAFAADESNTEEFEKVLAYGLYNIETQGAGTKVITEGLMESINSLLGGRAGLSYPLDYIPVNLNPARAVGGNEPLVADDIYQASFNIFGINALFRDFLNTTNNNSLFNNFGFIADGSHASTEMAEFANTVNAHAATYDDNCNWYFAEVDFEDNYYTPTYSNADATAYVNDGQKNWATVYVDFPFYLPEGAQAYVYTKNDELLLLDWDFIPAQTPVVISWETTDPNEDVHLFPGLISLAKQQELSNTLSQQLTPWSNKNYDQVFDSFVDSNAETIWGANTVAKVIAMTKKAALAMYNSLMQQDNPPTFDQQTQDIIDILTGTTQVSDDEYRQMLATFSDLSNFSGTLQTVASIAKQVVVTSTRNVFFYNQYQSVFGSEVQSCQNKASQYKSAFESMDNALEWCGDFFAFSDLSKQHDNAISTDGYMGIATNDANDVVFNEVVNQWEGNMAYLHPGTTLAWIIQYGTINKEYTIADDYLTAVYVDPIYMNTLFCKDNGGYQKADEDIYNEGQIDYMGTAFSDINGNSFAWNQYDQSNWVKLILKQGLAYNSSEYDNLNNMISNYRVSNIKGKLTDKLNPTIELSVTPSYTPVNAEGRYVFNKYIPANFTGTQVSPVNGKAYFFLKPKPCEIATLTWAVWDGTGFVIPGNYNPNNPNSSNGINSAQLTGEVNGINNNSDDSFNISYNRNISFEVGKDYHEFRVAITKNETQSNKAPKNRASRSGREYTVNAIDLDLSNPIVTSVADVTVERQVADVEYVNLAGQRSAKPWQGVNIVVTRYTDGTTRSTKAIM